ncbi:MAG TPA: GNAT family N-acetyltransferase [Gemmatimonadales bacterium]|jgi:RimJ/RimL family protein N-acetyltransferase|nr:GNAT family N-acetyltransferase [Gemmatimonadales bacterium]
MELEFPGGRIRSWRAGDAPSLARHADNRKIWLQVRDRFPHPYTLDAAESWVALASAADPETQFAIEVNGEAAGGIGVFLQQDVERYSAEIGYWLGEAHWNRGITSAAVRRFTDYAFDRFGLCRLYANVFETNPGSCRVLERAGYQLEGRLRRAAVKDGQVLDGLLYAAVREFQG